MFFYCFIVVLICYPIITVAYTPLAQDFPIQMFQLRLLWGVDAIVPFYCSFLVNSNGFQKSPRILCHLPLLVEIHGLLRLIRDSEQFQGCFAHNALYIPCVKVSFEDYWIVEGNCDMQEFAIWKIMPFNVAIGILDSV